MELFPHTAKIFMKRIKEITMPKCNNNSRTTEKFRIRMLELQGVDKIMETLTN
jgi:hypothetical protein